MLVALKFHFPEYKKTWGGFFLLFELRKLLLVIIREILGKKASSPGI